MKDIKFLEDITTIPGGSGDEGLVRNLLKEEISKVTNPEVDGFGNVIGRIGQGKKVIAVCFTSVHETVYTCSTTELPCYVTINCIVVYRFAYATEVHKRH